MGKGCLIIDDSTLDKLYSRQIALVTRHWSGKHRAVVQGINLITVLWTDGERYIPIDYRIYDKANDGFSKNDHFQALLHQLQQRGFTPECVIFDSWYASLPNLKLIRDLGWRWLTRLKANRLVNPDGQGNRGLDQVDLREHGTQIPKPTTPTPPHVWTSFAILKAFTTGSDAIPRWAISRP